MDAEVERAILIRILSMVMSSEAFNLIVVEPVDIAVEQLVEPLEPSFPSDDGHPAMLFLPRFDLRR